MPDHVLYEPSDFTQEERWRGNVLARYVVEGGLGICKKCGAAEVELDDYPTCESYRQHKRGRRK